MRRRNEGVRCAMDVDQVGVIRSTIQAGFRRLVQMMFWGHGDGDVTDGT